MNKFCHIFILLNINLYSFMVTVPDMEVGCCLGPEGNGVNSGEGG
jgi:hypothetical protein